MNGTFANHVNPEQLFANEVARQAQTVLEGIGYPTEDIPVEIGARLIVPGAYQEFDLTANQADALEGIYIQELQDHNGTRANEVVQAILRAHPQARAVSGSTGRSLGVSDSRRQGDRDSDLVEARRPTQGTDDSERGSIRADLATLGLSKLLTDDVIPSLQTAAKGMVRAWDDIKSALAPASLGYAAKLTAQSARVHAAELARSTDRPRRRRRCPFRRSRRIRSWRISRNEMNSSG